MSVGRGDFCAPLDFEIISKKRLFFQFRGVKNKFHRFWPPPGKTFWENPLLAPLEKILPTPMVPSIRENYHWVPRIRQNWVPRIREIGSLQVHTGT